MPLVLELRSPSGEWQPVNYIVSGGPEGSLVHFDPRFGPQLYFYGCVGNDAESYIRRSLLDTELSVRSGEVLLSLDGYIEIIRLHDTETYFMQAKTDKSLPPREIRFRHIKLDFGTTRCPVCRDKIANQFLGSHIVFDHSQEELKDALDDVVLYLHTVIDRLGEAAELARGFWDIQVKIIENLDAVRELIKELMLQRPNRDN